MRFIAAAILTAVFAASSPADPPAAFKLSVDERAVLDLVNAERARANLPPLKSNELLTRAARDHTANMARQGQLNHTLDGKGPGERLAAVGYRHAGWGENVAMGQPTPADAMADWMSSDGHRGNILGIFSEVGIGVAADANGHCYWTQVFAVPAR